MNIGIDCSTALTAKTAALFKQQGCTFVGRYVTPGSRKSITLVEAEIIRASGLEILSVFERDEYRSKGGAINGAEDGRLAYQHVRSIFQPIGSVICFAVDYDAPPSQYDNIEAYLRAAATQIPGYKVGLYASYFVIEEMNRRGVCTFFWQTVAWSKGKLSQFANVFQRQIDVVKNGIGIDWNEQYKQGGLWGQEVSAMNTYGVVNHERFYSNSGTLIQVPRKADGKISYSVLGTDVRWVTFGAGSIDLEYKHEIDAKVSELVTKYGALYGFNFPFFNWDGTPLGDTEDDDVVISSAYGKMLKWHEFASVNGLPVIGQLNVADHQEMLVQAGPLLLENGVASEDWYRRQEEIADDIGLSRAQRTWIGIKQNGDFILAICDGRTKFDQGFTLMEERLFMQLQGAVNALNGDGGSSTVLADKTGSLGQNKGPDEKAVHHAVLIFPKKEGYKMTPEDANKLISLLQAAHAISPNPEFHRLANELRKASGQPEEQ